MLKFSGSTVVLHGKLHGLCGKAIKKSCACRGSVRTKAKNERLKAQTCAAACSK